MWSILAHVHRRDGWHHNNPSRVSNYTNYVNEVNMTGVDTPTPATGIFNVTYSDIVCVVKKYARFWLI